MGPMKPLISWNTIHDDMITVRWSIIYHHYYNRHNSLHKYAAEFDSNEYSMITSSVLSLYVNMSLSFQLEQSLNRIAVSDMGGSMDLRCKCQIIPAIFYCNAHNFCIIVSNLFIGICVT